MSRRKEDSADDRTLLDALVELVGGDAADPPSMTGDRRTEIGNALNAANDGVKLAHKTAAERRREARASYAVLAVIASHEREAFKTANPDKAWRLKDFYGLGPSAADRAANIGDEFRELARREESPLFTAVKVDLLDLSQKALEEQLRVYNGKDPRTPHPNQATRSRKAISTRISGAGGVIEHLAQCPDEVESVVHEFLDAVGVLLPAAIRPVVASWANGKGVNHSPEQLAAGAHPDAGDLTSTTPAKVQKKGAGTLFLILHDYDLGKAASIEDLIAGRDATPQCVIRASTAEAAEREFIEKTGDAPVLALPMTKWKQDENRRLKEIGKEPWAFNVARYEQVPRSERPYPTLEEYLAARAPSTSDVNPSPEPSATPSVLASPLDCGTVDGTAPAVESTPSSNDVIAAAHRSLHNGRARYRRVLDELGHDDLTVREVGEVLEVNGWARMGRGASTGWTPPSGGGDVSSDSGSDSLPEASPNAVELAELAEAVADIGPAELEHVTDMTDEILEIARDRGISAADALLGVDVACIVRALVDAGRDPTPQRVRRQLSDAIRGECSEADVAYVLGRLRDPDAGHPIVAALWSDSKKYHDKMSLTALGRAAGIDKRAVKRWLGGRGVQSSRTWVHAGRARVQLRRHIWRAAMVVPSTDDQEGTLSGVTWSGEDYPSRLGSD